MGKSKVFQSVYLLTLGVFLTLGTISTLQLIELHRGQDFYRQIGETVSAASSLPEDRTALPSGCDDSPQRLSRFAKEYPAVALWIQLPETPLDYPVMLGQDNQFYLNHLPDGSRNALGSLFLDYRTDEDSAHLIVYGHNGSCGRMFGLLKQYESEDYFQAHPVLKVVTPDSVYHCPIFSIRRVNGNSDAYRLEFEDRADLDDYIQQAAAESLYQADIDLGGAKRVLTLSTCTDWGNQRLIVQAVMR